MIDKRHALPWEVPYSVITDGKLIYDADGDYIASTDSNSWIDDGLDEINAQLIVKAVNNHDALVEALKQAQELFEKALPKFDWGKSGLDAQAITLLNVVPLVVAKALKGVE